jgi:membrane protease YdiL (CAAX protease family)
MRPMQPTIDRGRPRGSLPFDLAPERVVPVWLVVLTYAWIEAAWDGFAWTFLGPSAVSWKSTGSASDALIQGIPQNAVAIGLTLAIVAWLGWWGDIGLGAPRRSPPTTLIVVLPTAAFLALGSWRAAGAGISPALMGAALLYYVVQPAGEEIIYRGFLLTGFTRRIGVFGGVVLSSALFALAHFVPWGWPPTTRSFALLFGFGVVTCAMRIASGSIWYPVFFHGLSNMLGRTYDWVGDRPVPEATLLWYWRRSIGVVGVVTAVLWLGGIVVLAWLRLMNQWPRPGTPSPDVHRRTITRSSPRRASRSRNGRAGGNRR